MEATEVKEGREETAAQAEAVATASRWGSSPQATAAQAEQAEMVAKAETGGTGLREPLSPFGAIPPPPIQRW